MRLSRNWSTLSAIAARGAWSVPFILCFFPEQIREEKPRSPGVQVVHALVDDSASMELRMTGTGQAP